MAFRHDMVNKTPQQRAIVTKRDEADKLIRKENEETKSKSEVKMDNSKYVTLVIEKDSCPQKDYILMKDYCLGCKHFKGNVEYLEQVFVMCSYSSDLL